MNVERPASWRPPSREHGGENIPELYAQMLLNEVVAMMFVETRDFNLPIAQGIEAVTAAKNQTSQRLETKGRYFYKPDGSVFMDYKIMCDEAYRRIGQQSGEKDLEKASVLGYQLMKAQFSLDMSTEEALQVARNIINSWNWE